MTNMTNYVRKFIILKKDHSNMGDINPKGHGKLEGKGGNINFSLKIDNAEDNSYYKILFISGKNSYELGKIYTKDNRSGVAEFNLNERDLKRAGFPLEKINAILVLREEKILLGGYFDKEDKSIDKYIRKIEDSPQDSEEEKIEDIEEDLIPSEEISGKEKVLDESPVEDEKVDNKDSEQEITTEDNYTEVMEEVFEDLEKDDSHTPIEDIFEESSNKVYNDYQEEESAKLHRSEQTLEYILNILNYFPYMKPFDIDLKGYDWWKIDVEEAEKETSFLPYFEYVLGNNHKYPGGKDSGRAQNLIRKYKHYLFGIYSENNRAKFFIYALPGKFEAEDHPQGGDTGFNTWFKARDISGYWLLYIDVASGRIIYPINPMKPID